MSKQQTEAYESRTIVADAELDDWEHGCQDEGMDTIYEWPISQSTLAGYLAELGEHLLWRPLTKDDIDWDADGGRLSIAGTVNADWTPADAREIEEWKAGKRKLYYARWSVLVYKVVREPVALEDIEKKLAEVVASSPE